MLISELSATTPKTRLIVRDGVTFATLCIVTAALFAITLLLFRSFERHRAELGHRWSDRGRRALQQSRPQEAVVSLRTALSYEPDQRDDQLLLARALADSGRIEEASNYFLSIWEQRPGDGFVNLQLARLERKKGDAQSATNYYRASIFGTWQGDGADRRREVRLELARYLAERGDVRAAQAEILIAAGNAPEKQGLEVTFGDQLQTVNDLPDALAMYRKAIVQEPGNYVALAKAGRVAYAMGDYVSAHKFLTNALQHDSSSSDTDRAEIVELQRNSERAQELNLSRDLPSNERAAHLQLAARIAQARLAACTQQLRPAQNLQTQSVTGTELDGLLPLQSRWMALKRKLGLHELARDAAFSDDLKLLIDETEMQTRQDCGQPEGDDALLLLLAKPTLSVSR
jgi:tetratricopeptide (TPR) repeat protein